MVAHRILFFFSFSSGSIFVRKFKDMVFRRILFFFFSFASGCLFSIKLKDRVFRRILSFFSFSSGCIFGRKFMKQFPWNVFGRGSYYKQPSYFCIDSNQLEAPFINNHHIFASTFTFSLFKHKFIILK